MKSLRVLVIALVLTASSSAWLAAPPVYADDPPVDAAPAVDETPAPPSPDGPPAAPTDAPGAPQTATTAAAPPAPGAPASASSGSDRTFLPDPKQWAAEVFNQ